MRTRFAAIVTLIVAPCIVFTVGRQTTPFHVEEATIAQIHAALRTGQTTCHALVAQYLARIDAYDKRGPSINAIVLLNPDALKTADEMDARLVRIRVDEMDGDVADAHARDLLFGRMRRRRTHDDRLDR